MAAMRARRTGRMPPEPPRRKGRRQGTPTFNEPMPRLARIKLSGGWADDGERVNGKSLALALTGFVLFAGAAIAGATWIGGSLFNAQEAMERSADSAFASLGFGAEEIAVTEQDGALALSPARMEEVRAVIVPDGRASLLSLDPAEVRARVESLDWVASARVRRLWPSKLVVEVQRREAFARWQEDGAIAVIDLNGERLLSERAADYGGLPLVVGRGAGPAAEPLLRALEELPQTRARIGALVRVEQRRWNAELKSGATIQLPEAAPERALARLETLHARYALLDRPVSQFDLRAPGRLAVRVRPQLAGGPLSLAGGA